MSSTSLWARAGGRVVPSVFTRGPWDPGLLHGGAVGALLAELAQERMDPDFVPVRLTVDLMKPVPLQPMTADVEVLRKGRRLQLLESELRFGEALVAKASLLALRPVPFDGGGMNPPLAPPPDSPDDADPMPWGSDPDVESFIGGGQEFRVLPSPALGAGVGWFRLARPVLDDGAAPSPLARAAAAADVSGAVSARHTERLAELSFINADFSVHLARAPEGDWIRLASTSRWGANGVGSVVTELGDAMGDFGTASQALVLDSS